MPAHGNQGMELPPESGPKPPPVDPAYVNVSVVLAMLAWALLIFAAILNYALRKNVMGLWHIVVIWPLAYLLLLTDLLRLASCADDKPPPWWLKTALPKPRTYRNVLLVWWPFWAFWGGVAALLVVLLQKS